MNHVEVASWLSFAAIFLVSFLLSLIACHWLLRRKR